MRAWFAETLPSPAQILVAVRRAVSVLGHSVFRWDLAYRRPHCASNAIRCAKLDLTSARVICRFDPALLNVADEPVIALRRRFLPIYCDDRFATVARRAHWMNRHARLCQTPDPAFAARVRRSDAH